MEGVSSPEKRPCGECTACCTVLGVDEIKKPAGTRCSNLNCRGCKVHGAHPAACADFECLATITGETRYRGNETGVVMYEKKDLFLVDRKRPISIIMMKEFRKGSFTQGVPQEVAHGMRNRGFWVLYEPADETEPCCAFPPLRTEVSDNEREYIQAEGYTVVEDAYADDSAQNVA